MTWQIYTKVSNDKPVKIKKSFFRGKAQQKAEKPPFWAEHFLFWTNPTPFCPL